VRTNFLISILYFISLIAFVACGGSGGDSKPTQPAANPPNLTGVNPAANDNSVLLGNTVAATFDKTMNVGSAGMFVVYGNQTGKRTGAYIGGGSQTLVFNPNIAFKLGEIVEVILTDSLTSTDGTSLSSPFVYHFWAEALGGTGNFNLDDTVLNQFGAQGLAAGDWDNDGDIDLAVANVSANTVVIMKNDSFGGFSVFDTVGSQFGASGFAAGDWDDDGDLDLAVTNFGNQSVKILNNDGTAGFTEVQIISPMLGATGLISGDWDGDGDLDLAVANFTANTVVSLGNDGTGSFAIDDTVLNQIGASGLATGDWNSDGDLDLAVANSTGGNNVRTLENL